MGQQCCKSDTVKFKAEEKEVYSVDATEQHFEEGNDMNFDQRHTVNGTYCRERELHFVKYQFTEYFDRITDSETILNRSLHFTALYSLHSIH